MGHITRKVWLAIYFILDILVPILCAGFFGVPGGMVTILLASVYGYILIRSFPTEPRQLKWQFFTLAIAYTGVVFGLKQWSLYAMASLSLGLGLALCVVVVRLDKTRLSRWIAIAFGLPLIALGVWMLWEIRPTAADWQLWSWGGLIYGITTYSYSRYQMVNQYFRNYYRPKS